MPQLQEHNIQTRVTVPIDSKRTMQHFPAERIGRGVGLGGLATRWATGCIRFDQRGLFVGGTRVGLWTGLGLRYDETSLCC
jgi:hypothetical protein